ncbi:MAG TPA: protein kinase [bacterium]|nr:protein kinase [bacterium]HPG46732.1 protein kinase [bacterium]HPM98938.1 protein kinase [bacterium]
MKFLPRDLTRDPKARERFIQEAQAASALDHPNICTIHEIDTTEEGQMFIAMSCYEGETLRQVIANGLLAIEKAIDIAIQIAEGLHEAHQKRIVHRDIKPANILLTTRGEAKILDFGLAKLSGQTQLTREGTTLGTTAYMSPEQARGDELDQRTDIWSLGAVLYEMVTGCVAFKGEYDQVVLYSILNEEPLPLSTLRPDAPPLLVKVVDTCLQKEPSLRYQHIGALLADLQALKADRVSSNSLSAAERRPRTDKRRISIAAIGGLLLLVAVATVFTIFNRTALHHSTVIPSTRLVVLPFENLGPTENDYFTDGVTDELITRLASLSGLSVISRTSAIQYAKTDKSIEQIGKELQVSYALAGAVRWAKAADGSDQVRITPSLVRISDKTTLWAETYDRVLNDIFLVQSDISQRVVEKLGIALLPDEHKSVAMAPTHNLAAYQAFLRARYYKRRPHFTVENWYREVDGYTQAVQLDPEFALAFAEMARAHARFYYLWQDHSDERLEKAVQAAEQAKRLSPESAAVHLALGYYQIYAYRNPDRAEAEFAIAEKGMPNSFEIYLAHSAVATLRGDWQGGMESSRKAFELSPRDASVAVDLAEIYWVLRRFQESVNTCDLAIELAPDDAWPYLIKTFALWSWKGGFGETRALLQAVSPDHEWSPWSWFWQNMMEKEYQQAIDQLSQSSIDWIETKCWAMPVELLTAEAYDHLGENEKSLRDYQAAKILLQDRVQQHPDDPRYHSSLGIAYASLGQKEAALQEGRKAASLLTVDRDAFYGIPYIEDLAYIYLVVGETDSALARLDKLLSIPSWISPAWLQNNPRWSKLYKDPRFVEILLKHEHAD